MNTQAVSLEAKANQIKEQGLKVFENETRMPMYGVPYASPFITIALTHQGWVKVNYDGSVLEFGRHDMAIVPKGHVLMPLESSEDYCVTVVAISPQLFKEIATLQPNLHDHAEFHLNSVFHLNDEQFQGILGFIQMLHSISISFAITIVISFLIRAIYHSCSPPFKINTSHRMCANIIF